VQKILITGSEGFIGKALALALSSAGYGVVTLDQSDIGNSSYKCDIRDGKLAAIFKQESPNIVVHLAAQIDVMKSIKDPILDLEINGVGTLNVLQASIGAGVGEFIYINSGGAIYDPSSNLPITESSTIKPLSPYGISKFVGESYVRILCEENGIKWTSLALSNCYGPISLNQKGVIYEFAKDITGGKSPVIYGENFTRDFIFIDDVVRAIILTLGNSNNQRINISSGIETNILQLFIKVRELLRSDVEPVIKESRFGEIQQNSLSNLLAKEILGWSPQVELDKGLIKSLELKK
jgi:UDP-glucose 4-epimerase